MERAGRWHRTVRRVCLAALGLSLAASCSGPPAPLQYGGAPPGAPSTPPPKPPPKPSPPPAAAAAAAARGVTVVRGDTVYGIARRHGVPIRALIEANGLAPPYVLEVGQRLVLGQSRYHEVAPGETVYAISRLYDVDMHSLARRNGIGAPYTIAVGQRLLLPGVVARASRPPSTAAAGTSPPAQPPSSATAPAGAVARSKVPQPPPRSAKLFAWPLQGKIISRFGTKPGGLHNDGINIAGKRGTPVRAAANGVVAYVGNELRGFGNLLLLRHAGGWMTAYAHNDVLRVRRGDKVKRGQVIGGLGSSGHVTTPQLHFEIRKGAKAVDPLRYLGPAAAAGLSPGRPRADPPGPG